MMALAMIAHAALTATTEAANRQAHGPASGGAPSVTATSKRYRKNDGE
jgi:hypothetical protein